MGTVGDGVDEMQEIQVRGCAEARLRGRGDFVGLWLAPPCSLLLCCAFVLLLLFLLSAPTTPLVFSFFCRFFFSFSLFFCSFLLFCLSAVPSRVHIGTCFLLPFTFLPFYLLLYVTVPLKRSLSLLLSQYIIVILPTLDSHSIRIVSVESKK